MNHLHARTLSDLGRKQRDAANQTSLVGAMPAQALTQSLALLKNGLEIKIDRLSFTTPQGEALLNASFTSGDTSQINLTDKSALSRIFNVSASVSIPEEYLHELQTRFDGSSEAGDRLNSLIKGAIDHGYVARNGAKLESKIEVKNGQVSFNDIPYVPPQPASLAQSGSMPPLAKSMNCTACHAIDRRVVGPAWRDVARRYKNANRFEYNGIEYPLVEGMVNKVSRGGSGHWGRMPMPPNDPAGTKRHDITDLVLYILRLNNDSAISPSQISAPAFTPNRADTPHAVTASIPSFQLNESLDQFMAEMGEPAAAGATVYPHTSSIDHEMTQIAFKNQGVRLFFRNDNKLLETVRFDAPYAGKINGIGIGDSSSAMVSSLGNPVRPPWPFAGSTAYIFKDGEHTTRYDVMNGAVHTIFMLNR
jgi:cytochrome c